MASSYVRNLEMAPKQLVSKEGLTLGCFKSPVRKANLMEVVRPYARPIPYFLQKMQLREWQAFQVFNGQYFIMSAIYNAKKMALVQFIVYDIKSQKKWRYEKKVAPFSLQVPNSLYNTKCRYQHKDFTFEVWHDLDKNRLEMEVDIKASKKLPALKAHLLGLHDTQKFEPSVVSMPFKGNQSMYSHKCQMPVEGKIELDGNPILFKHENSSLIIDDHKGYYPFPTRYDWVTGMGFTPSNQRIGFNFTANQVENPEKYNENVLWVDGKIYPLPPIEVTRPNGYKGDWIIKDAYGQIDLIFHPVIHNAVDINLLLFRSKYQGPYGFFTGKIIDQNQHTWSIDQIFGMGEDFYLRI